MNDALCLSRCVPPPPLARTTNPLRRAAARLWQWWTLDEREAYLSKATDCADLERRLRHWDRAGPMRLPTDRGGW